MQVDKATVRHKIESVVAGKYKADNLPGGARALTINEDRVQEIEPLIRLMREIGAAHGGKTPGQVTAVVDMSLSEAGSPRQRMPASRPCTSYS